MSVTRDVAGFSAFGLAVRFWQLGILNKHLFSNPAGHVASMAAFGTLGYFVHHWDIRVQELLAIKRADITEKRQALIAKARSEEEQALSG
ncbi:hypothetical protein EV122DRAFT_293618 [Schizophyllum commune]|nr:hypothetical protein K525DRAFT_279369 [Schizophyllum commune Loenen D]KAI5836413.1 hypothetical protein K523DRAFT_225864 [Schizophyllum commune Tattone D]